MRAASCTPSKREKQIANDADIRVRTVTEAPPRWLWVAPVLFVMLWSAGYSAVRIGVRDCGPLLQLFLRYIGVLLILLPAYAIVRPPLPRSPRQWLHLVIVGALLQGIYFALANAAINLGASAAGLGIVLALQPILVALVAPYVMGEAVSGRAWFGLALGLGGAVIVIAAKAGIGDATRAGILTGCAALFFITAGTVWEKRFGSRQHPIVANIVQGATAAVIAFAAAWTFEPLTVNWTPSFIASLTYLVVGNSIVAMTLLLAMVRHGQATRASVLFFLVPPCSAGFAWLLLGESFPPLALLGMALAGAGVWLVRSK